MRTLRRLRTSIVVALLGAAPASATTAVPLHVDRDRSHIVAITGRAGLLAFLGHDHAVLATQWDARILVDPEDPSRAEATVVVPARALRIP